MSTEARDFVQSNGRKTIADQSYVTSMTQKYGSLLEGIQDKYTKGVTAIIMENQMDHLKSMNEDTLSANTGGFTKYIFPIVRRVFPNLIANQLVSVQPMTSPIGGVFTYDYRYGNRKGLKNVESPGNPLSPTYNAQLNANDKMIANFGSNYAGEVIDYEQICTDGNGVATVTHATNNGRRPQYLPIRAPGVSGQRTFSVIVNVRTVEGGGLTRVLTANAAGRLIDVDSNDCGYIDFATGDFSVSAKTAAGVATTFQAGNVIYMTYTYNSELVSSTANAVIPDINMNIVLETVTAESYKLRAKWSAEAVDDLRALHGIDAEAELVAGISNEIALEIDRKIIKDLMDGAGFSTTYDFSLGGSTVFQMSDVDAIRGLLTKIEAVSANIHVASGRAPANFCVVSPMIGAMLAQLTTVSNQQVNMDVIQPAGYGPMMANFGITRIGNMMNKYTIYQDPFMPSNQMLVGLKGSTFLDAGYVFAPYVPLQVTPTFQDPDDFSFKKGLRSRFATKMLRREYFGKITVSGLPTVSNIM